MMKRRKRGSREHQGYTTCWALSLWVNPCKYFITLTRNVFYLLMRGKAYISVVSCSTGIICRQ